VLTPALLVYMYSSMESAKQKKLYAGDNKLHLGRIGTIRGHSQTA